MILFFSCLLSTQFVLSFSDVYVHHVYNIACNYNLWANYSRVDWHAEFGHQKTLCRLWIVGVTGTAWTHSLRIGPTPYQCCQLFSRKSGQNWAKKKIPPHSKNTFSLLISKWVTFFNHFSINISENTVVPPRPFLRRPAPILPLTFFYSATFWVMRPNFRPVGNIGQQTICMAKPWAKPLSRYFSPVMYYRISLLLHI